MDKNQQLLFNRRSLEGRGGESRELHRVGAGEPSASTATDKILLLQQFLPQRGRLQKYGDKKLVKTQRKFALFSM